MLTVRTVKQKRLYLQMRMRLGLTGSGSGAAEVGAARWPGFSRFLGLCSDDSSGSLSIPNNSSHLDLKQQAEETADRPITARRRVKRATITPALPVIDTKIKAFVVFMNDPSSFKSESARF
ncbi:Hypothetical predicted protein [Scomber scombrus]|uniref:Uncharacterized protein n=1 Tax=Scomber scombrus TaxID=13677 RepID=A0AAV1Q4R3_SCOSC